MTTPVQSGARSRLRAARQDLLPAEARVADRLLDDGPEVLRLPVAQIASLAGASQATVVRLAQRLGYRGFQELRLDLARDHGADETRTVFEAVGPSDTPEAVAEKVAAAETAAIDETRRLLDLATLGRVVGALEKASRVETYGVGASGLVALDAAAKLRRLGLPAWSFPDSHQQAASASLLTPGCVAIAFSHSGATSDVLEAASVARDAGASVVAVTSFPLAPLASLADHVLLTGAVEPTERSGSMAARVAQLYVVDVLAVAYAMVHPLASQEALARTTLAVRDRRTGSPSRMPGGERP